ncbi:MAG: hypothetical protein ACKOX6_18700 [Bdellovibrio sp.]
MKNLVFAASLILLSSASAFAASSASDCTNVLGTYTCTVDGKNVSAKLVVEKDIYLGLEMNGEMWLGALPDGEKHTANLGWMSYDTVATCSPETGLKATFTAEGHWVITLTASNNVLKYSTDDSEVSVTCTK